MLTRLHWEYLLTWSLDIYLNVGVVLSIVNSPEDSTWPSAHRCSCMFIHCASPYLVPFIKLWDRVYLLWASHERTSSQEPAVLPLTVVAPHLATPHSHPSDPTSCVRFLLGCCPRKCVEILGWSTTQRKQISRVLFRAFSGPLVTHPSTDWHLSQRELACHFGVSGNSPPASDPGYLSFHKERVLPRALWRL